MKQSWAWTWALVRRRRSAAVVVIVGLLAVGAAGLDPARAESAGVVTVAPLSATVNAAAYGPMPTDAARYVFQRYDDSRETDAIQQALEDALARTHPAAGTAAGPLLEMEFEYYVIRSGVPEMAKGILETEDVRRRDGAGDDAPANGIDVTDLQGRTAGVEGNVFHRRQDSFSAVMRLQVSVRDPASGDVLWRGWVDTPLHGLSRVQAAELVAEPLMDTLGTTVAGREVVVSVPEAMGGAPGPAAPRSE
ncbi:hypothetical protein F1188_06400 [Roseospira marina]|uniref:DUF4136 domain-containing protein n=1 Tax=Roseospira marina TaxID=140057 RepID=A0A5M6IDX9_9PROT|nr:hypothetical protein [Roseospira marina]KAA5606491.1 hypothetical protein F1188_06400 [Roseospira marina]MBB4314088.1 hypothetical protein [Roseospira marina]MBB5087249.1 hypothetical protein [Roseospira marina]